MTIGAALGRKDGRAKVTGGATYTADVRVPSMTYGVLVTSDVPAGRIAGIDTGRAASAPGVLGILTHTNAPRLEKVGAPAAMTNYLPLQDDRIWYEGQPVALVVADTLERATFAASLVAVRYETSPAQMDLLTGASRAQKVAGYDEPDTRTGDPEAAIAAAPVVVRGRYAIGFRHHNPMEPSATTAVWDGDQLTVYDATQHIWGVRAVLATAFGLEPARIRVVSQYLGGGFGCKGYVWPHQLAVPMAARLVNHPVKLVLTRAQMYAACGFQTETHHDVALGAGADGRLRGIRHDVVYANCVPDEFPEYQAAGSRSMYACPAIGTTHRAVKVNLIQPTAMRAPNEGMGNFALESAMDELAERLALDPLELRLTNYADHDPTSGLPFSSKKLREAYALGAQRFGWSARSRTPRSVVDGNELVGMGMASCLMTSYRFPSAARVVLTPDGRVVVQAGAQEIGTGIRTIMPQIAADVLGIEVGRVTMELGDTHLVEAGPTYGSSSTMGLGSAVADAAAKARARLDALKTPGESDRDALRRHGKEIVADGAWSPASEGPPKHAIFGFGAVYAEVGVDRSLGLVRARRIVGAYSAGRIINPTTANSQMTGAMIWGVGQALLERSEVEPKLGRFVSKNLAGYLVPVNADIGSLEAHFVEEDDRIASAIGARGIGELGATGVAAAIANAVYNAVGVRVRELPIRPEALLDALV